MKRHFTKIVMTLVTLLSTPSTFAQTPDNVPSYFIANGTSPALAESKTLAHLVFVSQAAGNNVTDIFHTASGDAGKTWSTAVSISNTPGMSTEPSIAVESNGSLDAVWTDTSTSDKTPDIFFARSTDNGKTWTQPKDIANTPGKSSDPKIVVGKNNSLHVVWCDTSKGTKNRDIYYSSSIDGGEHWGKDPLLPATDISNTSGFSSKPTIAVDETGGVHVAWIDTTRSEDHPDVFYARTAGTSWTKPVDISFSVRKSIHASIACSRGKTYLCWTDNSRKEFAADVWLVISKSSETRFSKPENISNTPNISSQPDAHASGPWLGIVWSDQSTAADKPHIFARVSLDQGSDFSNVMDITTKSGACIHPKSTFIGKRMVVVWQERSGDQETLKSTSLRVDNIGTGPAMDVDPIIKGVSGNQH